ncbi:MAG: hypothetical protein GY764_11330 [Halieaceae bacterium]|nr:hypothetical protein [Halieaceae bacterium]
MFYVIKSDRDGGESDDIPFDSYEEAVQYGENCYDNPKWVSYAVFEADNHGNLYECRGKS